jgi:hypothetical protein
MSQADVAPKASVHLRRRVAHMFAEDDDAAVLLLAFL